MIELADRVYKTATINILHMFKTIEENMNMLTIEVLGGNI